MAGALSEHLGYPLFLLTSVTKWLITFYWNTILKFVLLWRNPTYKKSLLPLILVLLMATKSNLIYILLVFRSPASIYSVCYLLSYTLFYPKISTEDCRDMSRSFPRTKNITRNMEDQMTKFILTMMSCPCVLFNFSNCNKGRPFLYCSQLTA